MKAGFAKEKITPPVGTTMIGFADRDNEHGCKSIHDDLFVRALFLSHENENVLIMGFDLCFFGRDDAFQIKDAIARKLDFKPEQILLNTTHIHSGPAIGDWSYPQYSQQDKTWQKSLKSTAVDAACKAKEELCDVTLWAGATRSALPMNRRRKNKEGKIDFAPNPDGVIFDSLPVCLFKDMSGKPVSMLFSVSCHPSTVRNHEISADFPGVAMRSLDAHPGSGGSIFLQGAGGDTKPSVVGEGVENWRAGTWDDVEKGGMMVAQEVIHLLETGLVQIEPEIRTNIIDMSFPMLPPIERDGFEKILSDSNSDETLRSWAERQIDLLDRDGKLAESISITCHGVQLGKGMRIIGLECEPVAGIGHLIQDFYSDGISFPLGYTNGAQLYLPTSNMLKEGGYEVDSYYEYGFPSQLAEGIDDILIQTLHQMRNRGIE